MKRRISILGSTGSIARNEATRNAPYEDWWFFIDDDCLPPFDWMSKLVDAQAATGADVAEPHKLGACRVTRVALPAQP